LPALGHSLKNIQETVHNGFGFSIIRGLDIRKYDPNDRAVVFLALSSYIAEHRGPQDRRGTMLSPFSECLRVIAPLMMIAEHIMDDERKESQTDLVCPAHCPLCLSCQLMTLL
jgi:hypothetical protein